MGSLWQKQFSPTSSSTYLCDNRYLVHTQAFVQVYMCRIWCMSSKHRARRTMSLTVDEDFIVLITRWHLHRQPRSQLLLAATFDELATRCWYASGSTIHFGFHPSSVFVQHQTVEGFRVWQSHLGAHGLGPYTVTLIHCSFGVPFKMYFLWEASFHARMSPSVMFPSLVALSYKSTENLSVTASLSAAIVSVLTDRTEWLCYL